MKRYYVDHVDGMTSNSEFMEIRDQLAHERLSTPGTGREFRRVRYEDGRVDNRAFLHLWKDRREAEAFASRLRKGEEDRRWKVIEVDVEGTLDEILDPANLTLPDRPKVKAIWVRPYLDPTENDALDVRVILEGERPQNGWTWAELEPIYRAIHDTLSAEGITMYPYLWFRTASEFAREQGQGVS